MGRKGVSKRKTPKSKNQTVSSEGGNGAVPSTPRVSEALTPKSIGRGEAISVSKGGKKK